MLRLYNTLTKKLEPIEKKEHINLYTCGPTVYNYAHIGNLRAFIMADLLYRTLKYEGYNPRWVMNITDIDDKTIKGVIAEYGAKATLDDLKKFTKKFYQAFLNDLREVNVLADEIKFIKVMDVIPEIQKFITELMDKGYGYKADDGVYFSIEKYQKDFGDYGQLVGEKFLEGKKVGARVAVDEYEKDNLSDFALWKAHNPKTDGQIYWDHPVLGKGRPGWHIECSVINHVAFNGEPTDIHTGGVDLIFPHHTNEIAQSQALLGKGKFVKHWFHSEHLLVDGKKMAKRDGNIYTLKDLKEKDKLSPFSFRYLMLQSRYSTKQDFSFKSLQQAFEGYHKVLARFYALDVDIRKFIPSSGKEGKFVAEAKSRLIDDLDFPNAMVVLHDLLSPSNSIEVQVPEWLVLDEMLGLRFKEVYLKHYQEQEITSEVKKLVNQREGARKNKDFVKSDGLRKQIEALGYEVMDTPEGQKVRKKIHL